MILVSSGEIELARQRESDVLERKMQALEKKSDAVESTLGVFLQRMQKIEQRVDVVTGENDQKCESLKKQYITKTCP
jgi:hypothetical protein